MEAAPLGVASLGYGDTITPSVEKVKKDDNLRPCQPIRPADPLSRPIEKIIAIDPSDEFARGFIDSVRVNPANELA